jgi:hypothetical protein
MSPAGLASISGYSGPVANSGVDRTMGCTDPSFTLY